MCKDDTRSNLRGGRGKDAHKIPQWGGANGWVFLFHLICTIFQIIIFFWGGISQVGALPPLAAIVSKSDCFLWEDINYIGMMGMGSLNFWFFFILEKNGCIFRSLIIYILINFQYKFEIKCFYPDYWIIVCKWIKKHKSYSHLWVASFWFQILKLLLMLT